MLALILSIPAWGQNNEAENEKDIYELSPFEVDVSNDIGYYAQNTLAGSRMSTNVADLAASITVVTMQQLEDTASTDINDVFRYEANTEGSATYTPSVQSLRNDGVVDLSSGFTTGADGQSQTNAISNRVRGIGVPSSALNYYPANPQVPFDSYNTQSIEISRGPNSMLFGLGSPAGIVNQSTAQALINESNNRLSVRADDRGSFRTSFSFNRPIIEDKLAVYGALLYDNQEFERKPSFDKTKRGYVAVTWKPFEKTTLRANFETYDNNHRRPNSLTPRDSVTQWRTGGGWSYDPSSGYLRSTVTGEVKGPLAMRSGSPRVQETRNWIMSLPNYSEDLWNGDMTQYNGVAIYGGGALNNPASVLYTPGMVLANSSRPKMMIGPYGLEHYQYFSADRYRLGYGTATNPAGNADLVLSEAEIFANPVWDDAYNTGFSASDFWTATGNGIGSYRYPGVTNKDIYDWEKVNTLYMNFGERENKTYNVEFEQEILPDLIFNAGGFRQDFKSTTNYTVSQLNVATLYVDTNSHMPDGSINQNFGQPYVYDFDPDQFQIQERYDSYRAMLAWTPDFTDQDGWLKWLGRHQLLGLASKDENQNSFWRKRWFITDSDEGSNNTVFLTRNPNNNADGTPTGYSAENRSVQRMFYLAPDGHMPFGQVTQASGTFDNESYTGDMQYHNYGSSSWEGLSYTTGWVDHSAHTGRKERVVESESFGLTSYWWDDRLVTTIGTRKDKYKARGTTTGAILDEDGNQVEPGMTNPEKWVNGVFQTETVFNRWNRWDRLSGRTNTYGGVLRPFKNWNSSQSGFLQSLGFSYNKSDNFNPPDAAQVDAFGNPLPKPTGEGEDWGIQFSALDDKLFFRLNWFKATNDNERTNPGTSISRLTNNIDTTILRDGWARTIALINMGHDPTGTEFGQNLTAAETEQLEAAQAQIWQQPFDYYTDLGGDIYATRSAEAEGKELSIVYNPTPNWTMKFTGGEQETKYANVLKEFFEWYNVRYPVWQDLRAADFLGPQYQNLATYTTSAGREVNLTNFLSSYGYRDDVRLDNPDGLVNVQTYYDNIVAPQVAIASDLEGQAAPGQRKYRASFLSTYSFDEGLLKGFMTGGSVRWEDKAIIGYYGKPNPGTGSSDLTLSDVTRPIWDSANTYFDIWFGYTKKLNDKMRMKIQLNIVNAFESGELRTVAVNYDGSPNAFRIVDPRQFILTTTFDF